MPPVSQLYPRTPDRPWDTVFTNGTLAAGSSTQTARTCEQNRVEYVDQVNASYTGTITNVTLQLQVAGTVIGAPVAVSASGGLLRLLPEGMSIGYQSGDTVQVLVTNATMNDDLVVNLHGRQLVR